MTTICDDCERFGVSFTLYIFVIGIGKQVFRAMITTVNVNIELVNTLSMGKSRQITCFSNSTCHKNCNTKYYSIINISDRMSPVRL